jgi:hypothetical protein
MRLGVIVARAGKDHLTDKLKSMPVNLLISEHVTGTFIFAVF